MSIAMKMKFKPVSQRIKHSIFIIYASYGKERQFFLSVNPQRHQTCPRHPPNHSEFHRSEISASGKTKVRWGARCAVIPFRSPKTKTNRRKSGEVFMSTSKTPCLAMNERARRKKPCSRPRATMAASFASSGRDPAQPVPPVITQNCLSGSPSSV